VARGSASIAGDRRTYAYEKVLRTGQHLYPCDCAVYDSTLDQVYSGDSKRVPSGIYWDDWVAAVDDTKGKVILYRGNPIQALYSSSSGGHTENNENVWGGTPLPYLRGVPDAPDDNPANPNHTWSVSMSFRAFADELEKEYNDDPDTRFGDLRSFKLVRPFGVSGRVTVVKPGVGGGVRIEGTTRELRVSGWSIRGALGLMDSLFRVKISRT
jgi:SpoIID/LytB domain protein